MTRSIDKAILAGFVEEVRGYLPIITEGIRSLHEDPHQPEVIEETHRYAHTIKGAASMVGLAGLSHIAYYVEEALEGVAAGQLVMGDETAALLQETVAQIESYLGDVLSDTLRERPLLAEVTRAYRRLWGLPEKEDEAATERVLAEVEGDPPPAEEDAEDVTALIGAEADRYDEVSPELLETFSLEAEDHLRNISTRLSTLARQPERRDALQDIRRSVHTLKGAAGAVGLRAIARLAHRMEDLLDRLYDGSLTVDPDVMDVLFTSADTLEDLTVGEVEGEIVQDTLRGLYADYSTLLGEEHLAEGAASLPSISGGAASLPSISGGAASLPFISGGATRNIEPLGEEPAVEVAEPAPRTSEDEVPEMPQVTAPTKAPRKPGEVVRVPLERLDQLVRLTSELSINRTVFEQRLSDFVRAVDELQFSTSRLRRVSSNLETQYEVSALGGRWLPVAAHAPHPATTDVPSKLNTGLFQEITFNTHGFDELEFDRYTEFHRLSRELSETASDIRTVSNELGTLIGDFGGILNRQGRLSSEIQDRLMQMRMVPLAALATRLHRAVRVLAREQGKLVDLVLEGEDIELDKTVLEEMADPLLHLLRNAVDHGIEPPALRQVMGKSERGLIRLHASHEGNQVVIQVSDDGAGLEPEILRSVAVSKGYVPEADAAQLSDKELRSLVFLPGFSTADEVSEVSGRGVGLDVVKTNVHRLKGTVTLDSDPGQGATFTIRLPMTLAITRALLVQAHRETFAVPLDSVLQILRLGPDEIEHVGQEPVVRIGGQVYPVFYLGKVLNLTQPADETVERFPVLILNTGVKRVALAVDQLVAGREIVIKPLGNHLRRVHGLTGATLMGDGSVVLILNPAELAVEPERPAIRSLTPIHTRATAAPEATTVMIVDDSVSVRRVVSNLIKNGGWQPVAAKDGLEAIEIIQRSAQPPDLILVDIEMPRMDGYELMSKLKGQEAYRDVPLVVLTSRAGKKHRRKALDLGASEYVVKPYQDEALLGIIRHLVQESRGAVLA